MGSSAKKKKEKKKDFQKAKLKVGKQAAKPANHTSTAFKAKSIALKQHTLSTKAPTVTATFVHALSLLSSKTESQRKEALASITNIAAATSAEDELPQPIAVIMPKVEPMLLDSSQGVRTQLLRLLEALAAYDQQHQLTGSAFAPHASKLLLYIVAALNHLSSSVRDTGLSALQWLLQTIPHDLVASQGGFQKPLLTILGDLGWSPASSKPDKASGWSMAKPATTSATQTNSKSRARHLEVLAQLLRAGLAAPAKDVVDLAVVWFPLRHGWVHNVQPQRGAYDYLELFAPPAARNDDENARLPTHDERRAWYQKTFADAVRAGVESAKSEGGEVGRAAKLVENAQKW